jgi:hypothetical protein
MSQITNMVIIIIDGIKQGITSVLDAVVVGGSDLNVMISMFNMAKSIYKDHFRISCSKILSNVVILQCPK